jgi:hypothetical protein
MSKQPTLAFFKFKKTIKHRDEEIDVALDKWAKEPKVPCPECNKQFLSKQGLSVHIKCLHPDAAPPETRVEEDQLPSSSSSRGQSTSSATETHALLPMDNDKNDNEENQNATSPMEAQNNETDASQEISQANSTTKAPKNNRRGQNKRTSHSLMKKAEVIFAVESGVHPDEEMTITNKLHIYLHIEYSL